MIREVKGDLISMVETGLVDMMAHGCNCVHAMGSGIAGQLAARYPNVPEADRRDTGCGDFSKVGTFSVAVNQSAADPDTYFIVFNMYTQKTPSYDGADVFEYTSFPSNLERLKETMESIIESPLVALTELTIGFPQIGAGLAGGDWPRIKQMIVDVFNDHATITAVLVEYQPAGNDHLVD